MTNNPQKVATMQKMGIDVVERVPLHVGINEDNEHYLHTKIAKMGHFAD